MNSKCRTFHASIYVAGDFDDVRRLCKEFCAKGLCVTVEKLHYCYTGGEESGVRVGLINYPRFPKSDEQIRETALDLAEFLRGRLYEDSFTVVFPDETVWSTHRQ